MKKEPLISVVMPARNVEHYVSDAIESVLNQTYKNFEFIIIEDSSTDSTLDIIKGFKKKDRRIILIRNENNLGVTISLNKGVKKARGKYIIRMDADDWSYPNRFESQVKLMEDHPDVVVSGFNIEVCNAQLKTKYVRKYHQDDSTIRKHLFRYSPFAHPATIWKAGVLRKELYNEKIRICQDYELYFRVGKIGKFKNLNKTLLKLRLHNNSVSRTMNDLQSKATILIRLNSVLMLGYNMTTFDKFYNFMQEVFIGLIPVKLRFLIYNFLRRFNFY